MRAVHQSRRSHAADVVTFCRVRASAPVYSGGLLLFPKQAPRLRFVYSLFFFSFFLQGCWDFSHLRVLGLQP